VSATETTTKTPGRGQFKCFQCRKIFQMKDGDWHLWKSMEVHLCLQCEKLTRDKPERNGK
jgi:hypothetical protein